MKIHNLIKPVVLSVACVLAASANAGESRSKYENKMEDYNFATLKAGLVSPTALGGNSGLDTGDTTYTAGFSVGRKMQERFAVELEYMYRGKNTARSYNSTVTPGDNNNAWAAQSNTFMANVSADLLEDCKLMPYVKAGLGMSSNKSDDYTNNVTTVRNDGSVVTTTRTYQGRTKNSFAWQIGAGLNMKTTEMFDTQIQYMYVDRGKIETYANYTNSVTGVTIPASARTGRLKDHVITLGLTKKF